MPDSDSLSSARSESEFGQHESRTSRESESPVLHEETTSHLVGEKAKADVGIISALPVELAPFLKRCERVRKYQGGAFVFRGGIYDKVRVAIVETGLGFARARKATFALLDGHAPTWILAAGFCGALIETMNVGDIVIPNEIVDTHQQQFEVELNISSRPEVGLHVGRLLTNDELVRKIDEKKQLAEQYQAIAVDLESLAVAQVCQETKTRFMSVRAVSDDLARDLPAEILTIFGSTGSARLGATVGAILKRPGSVKDMWRLKENAWKAADHLTTFLDGIMIQIWNDIQKNQSSQ